MAPSITRRTACSIPKPAMKCSALVAAAVRHQVGVIPFGGGTNIAGCLEPIGIATA